MPAVTCGFVHVIPRAGTSAAANVSEAAIETPEPYEPSTIETPFEINSEAAVTALSFEDSLSTISS